jgi:hypothetical protein
MPPIKPILSAIVGILLIASLVGYSGQNVIDDVPKPDIGLCGVTKESYSDVPGSGLILDIDVDVSWDDNTVWIGIIDVATYDSLEKLGGNSDGELVPCDSKINFIAGGPESGDDSKFTWVPNGDEFHIMIGSMEEADDDDDGGIWPLGDNDVEEQSFVDEFTVTVNYDASGGWGVIILLFIIEIGLVYATALDRR